LFVSDVGQETLIKQMENKSGVKFLQAQVALARQWVADDTITHQKEVAVVIPQETKEGIVVQKPSEKVENIPIPPSESAARDIIARFESGAPRGDSDVSDSVSSHMLRDKTSLFDEKWLGTEAEELNS
jgi:phospholipase D1/2